MRFNIALMALGLVFSASALANSPLRSQKLKQAICSSVEYEVERHDEATRFDSKACLKGEFTIVNSSRDPRTSAITLMKVNYAFSMGQFAIKGQAVLAATQSPDENGRMVQTWGLRSTRSTFNDSRDIVARIAQELETAGDNVDMHNGDFGMSKNPGYTVAKAKRDLLEALPNDSCEYDTSEGIDSVLNDYTLREGISETNLRTLLEQAKAQGKIKGAVMRTYSDGESEYCSHYYYVIIFTDGNVLEFNMDLTT